MKKRKLNYRFHNPNSAAETADQLLRVLIEANRGKVEATMQAAAKLEMGEAKDGEGHSA